LGKSNTSELTLSSASSTENQIYGRTNNPYDLNRSPSGSSGGAAAIIAAGGSVLDIGSDTGGSIREPAHVCGISAIKPTFGRVPKTGHCIPFGLGAIDHLTHIGPMARYVEDLWPILQVICGPDGRDSTAIPVPLLNPADVEIKALNIAFYSDNGVSNYDPAIPATVIDVVKAITGHVHRIDEVIPPRLHHAATLFSHQHSGDGFAWVARLMERNGTCLNDSSLNELFANVEPLPVAEFSKVHEQVDAFRAELHVFMQSHDAIICPGASLSAPLHDEVSNRMREDGIDLTAHNLSGFPAAVVRTGWSGQGLPIGVQIIGKPWREDVVLALAGLIETICGGFQPPLA
jgi:amidase